MGVIVIEDEGIVVEGTVEGIVVIDRFVIGALKNSILAIYWVVEKG